MSNAPDRFELFLLADGEKKVEVAPDTRTPNTAIITMNKEDHTLGNLIRSQLVKSENVLFAAYKIPHPLFAKVELRVQTDGTISPTDAVKEACKALITDLAHLRNNLTREFELKRMAQDETLRD